MDAQIVLRIYTRQCPVSINSQEQDMLSRMNEK